MSLDISLKPSLLAPICAHWWEIEPPHGAPTVHGICKRCKAERDFPAAEPPPARPGHMPWVSQRDIGYVDGHD